MEGTSSSNRTAIVGVFLVLLFSAHFRHSSSATRRAHTSISVISSSTTSAVLPLLGNVYPTGYYYASVKIGHPPKTYYLDVDTGSDLTWVQCDAPCQSCLRAPHHPYVPVKTRLVRCNDRLCDQLHWPSGLQCLSPDEQCDYEVKYADFGSSLGVLIRDKLPLRFTNGSSLAPNLAFGCGYDQQVPSSIFHPFTDGVLGLGNGKMSIVSQLNRLGLTRNVVGHCLSSRGGGFLFFGDDIVPSRGIVWAPMLGSSSLGRSVEKHYSSRLAELHLGTQPVGFVKSLPIIFDSGSTYTYLSSQAYEAVLSLIRNNLNGKKFRDAAQDNTLPICWKGNKRFKSIKDIKRHFNPLVLKFANTDNAMLQIPPESYLIVTEQGNVCLGILNGSEKGLGNLNIIGDISMQDKMVIYDNEKQQIGWIPADCQRLPGVDLDYTEEGFSQYLAENMGIPG